jgi:excisionase family DNA binding protein
VNQLEGAFLRNLIQNESQKPRSRTKVGHYISVAEAAKRLGVSAKTVTRWCESGTLAAIEKPFGNKTTYDIHPKSVEVLLFQQEEAKQQIETAKAQRNFKPHSSYVDAWKRAMAKGLLTGKPYSKATIDDYSYHTTNYFQRFSIISIDGLKAGLVKIPTASVAKRQHFFKALLCLAKYLI